MITSELELQKPNSLKEWSSVKPIINTTRSIIPCHTVLSHFILFLIIIRIYLPSSFSVFCIILLLEMFLPVVYYTVFMSEYETYRIMKVHCSGCNINVRVPHEMVWHNYRFSWVLPDSWMRYTSDIKSTYPGAAFLSDSRQTASRFPGKTKRRGIWRSFCGRLSRELESAPVQSILKLCTSVFRP